MRPLLAEQDSNLHPPAHAGALPLSYPRMIGTDDVLSIVCPCVIFLSIPAIAGLLSEDAPLATILCDAAGISSALVDGGASQECRASFGWCPRPTAVRATYSE